ncbi:hypothetical protein N8J89_23835 [Crossiella sp. CA-258035]|uniref:hypothetical protein n=1 Tax=Crossiella sp. CA-258035 TaxID=2981138 RepID=UPI0024BCD79F|nr:hypothetical protein [Crossiella sp. CA-258035]WHT16161.1 hypothetical protein N8J89_23835 [Crossiella sp. CA-258035]
MSIRGDVGHRFRDPLVEVGDFARDVLVRCPACGDRAIVRWPAEARWREGGGPPRWRLFCFACGKSKDIVTSAGAFGEPVDPYFRLPLWLQANCGGKVLWAYNAEHLDFLEALVAARIRERWAIFGTVSAEGTPGAYCYANDTASAMSLMSRLPGWLKLTKNREQVLHVIRRLRSSLPPAPGSEGRPGGSLGRHG